jgi:hypothetical protein
VGGVVSCCVNSAGSGRARARPSRKDDEHGISKKVRTGAK